MRKRRSTGGSGRIFVMEPAGTESMTGRILSWFLILIVIGIESVDAAEPPVTALAVANQDQWLLVGSQQGVRLCDPDSLKVIREWKPGYAQVHDLLVLPPAGDQGWRLLVVGGTPAESGMMSVLRLPEMTLEQHRLFEGDVLYSAARSAGAATGVRIWVGGHDHRVHRLELDDEAPEVLAAGHSKGVTAVVSLGGDRGVVSGGLDQSLRLWNSTERTPVRSWNNHTAAVTSLARRPGTDSLVMVASASEDRTVRLWQPTIGRMVRFVRLESVPRCIGWTRDGSRLVAGCDDGVVRIIDPETVEVQTEFPLFRRPVVAMTVFEKSDLVVAGGFGGAIKRLDLRRDSEPSD